MSVISIMNGKPRELNQGGTGTTILAFTTDGTVPVVCPLMSCEQLAGANSAKKSRQIRVTAYGRVTGGGTTNYTATLQFGTSATPGSNTTIEASTARAVNSEAENWVISVDLTLDSTSNKLNGRGWSQVGNLVDAYAVIDNQITAADPDGGTALGFVACGTFSSGFAGNLSYLDGMTIELLD